MTTDNASSQALVEAVTRYVRTYLEPAPVQPSESADTDPQLATIMLHILDWMRRAANGGVIIDVGCGRGTLLQRLIDDANFSAATGWLYVPIDTDQHLDEVQRLARKAKIGRRVESMGFQQFYSEWPVLGSPQLVFCRNVFHELTIPQTSTLLRHVAANLRQGDLFICQDLITFPEGERHNAAWTPDELVNTIREHGLSEISCLPQRSRSGAAWFNILAGCPPGGAPSLSEEDSLRSVVDSRHQQWAVWSHLDELCADKGQQFPKILNVVDLDVQLAALTRQLREARVFVDLDAAVSKRLRSRGIAKLIGAFVAGDTLLRPEVSARGRLRERGEQLDALEQFLRGESPLAVLSGGVGTGKSMLAEHLLSTRSYDKSPVILIATPSMDVWSMLESLFSQLGLRLRPEVLAVLDNLTWESIEVPLRQFVNQFGSRMILFVDNFDVLLDSNGAIQNAEVAKALSIVVRARGAKVLLAQRGPRLVEALLEASGDLNPTVVRLGRYATDQTVVNILDDRFDRSSARVDAYPESLLRAIDRHPLAAMLCAEILHRQGSGVLDDSTFLAEVRHRLHQELWGRLVDSSSFEAMGVATQLRTAVPRSMLEGLSTRASVLSGLASSALYVQKDRCWEELVAALAVLRRRTMDDAAEVSEEASQHRDIADHYLAIYRRDDDPKWIRESYFHRMLAGAGSMASTYYVGELVASAEYCFVHKRDFKEALELYEAATRFVDLPEAAQMHRASCHIRIGDRAVGEAEFAKLVVRYPGNKGMRTSFVDALLFVQDYAGARRRLEDLGLLPDQSDWVAGQWGRAFLGLNQYSRAEAMFRKQLAAQGLPTAQVFLNLARVLQYQGAAAEALAVLEQARQMHPSDQAILVAVGAALERLRRDDDSLAILEPLFELQPFRTPAALSIIKILGRRRETQRARRVFERACKHSDETTDGLLLVAEAELLKAENRPEAAIRLLVDSQNKDQHTVGMLLECWFHLAKGKSVPAERTRIAKEALADQVPDALLSNVPIIVNRGRLAALVGDEALFGALIAELRATRAESFEVVALDRLWKEHNTGGPS